MKDSSVDTSGFQNIVLMLIGVLMVMLISNVVTIISNPDNIKIGALVTGGVYGEDETKNVAMPKFQNMRQDPVYIDVEANRMIIYEPPSRPYEVLAREMLLPGNDFDVFLDWIEARKTSRYVVLLLRPGSAKFQRRLRQICRERGIDVGFEPWDVGRTIDIAGAAQGALRIRPARTTLEAEGIDPDMFWRLQGVEGATAGGVAEGEEGEEGEGGGELGGDDLDDIDDALEDATATTGEGA